MKEADSHTGKLAVRCVCVTLMAGIKNTSSQAEEGEAKEGGTSIDLETEPAMSVNSKDLCSFCPGAAPAAVP